MSCTYWLSKNAQCGKASPSVSIGKTIALCDEHATTLRAGLSRFVASLSFAARESRCSTASATRRRHDEGAYR